MLALIVGLLGVIPVTVPAPGIAPVAVASTCTSTIGPGLVLESYRQQYLATP